MVADALTYCDMTTGPTGESLTLGQRLDDIERRHGSGSLVMQALRAAQPELVRCVAAIEAAMRAIDEPAVRARYDCGSQGAAGRSTRIRTPSCVRTDVRSLSTASVSRTR